MKKKSVVLLEDDVYFYVEKAARIAGLSVPGLITAWINVFFEKERIAAGMPEDDARLLLALCGQIKPLERLPGERRGKTRPGSK